MNTLYYGDNLDVLPQHIAAENVDLIYLDPPFNSTQNYNVLFAEKDGTRSAAQIKAFEDTWRWDQASARAFQEVVEQPGPVAQAMLAFRTFLGDNDMLAYLSMMAPRLKELKRVLKSTGSIYLHCDPTASHYLKMLMDAVFTPSCYRNEIIWKRTTAHSSARRCGPIHDVILFYSKSDKYTWNPAYQPYEAEYVAERYKRGGERPWRDENLTGSGIRHGETGKAWRGFDVTAKGRHWAYLPSELDEMDTAGRIYWPKKKGGWPRELIYLDEALGIPLQDIWGDISPVNSQAEDRLGYPTQKPEALLERIIMASSDEGHVVLDPFCGCGTAVAVAQRLKRQWIGVDITHLAITLIRHRLADSYGPDIAKTYAVIGEPTSVPDAEALAQEDQYQFQWWALGLVGARPTEQKKGADKGIDGRLNFHDEALGGKTRQIILSVKAGHVTVSHLRDLRGVLDRENADIGVLICMEEPTKPMRTEAAGAGFYEDPVGNKHPRLQILTVAELLTGKTVDYPRHGANVTFKKAPKVERPEPRTFALPLVAEGPAAPDRRPNAKAKRRR